MVSILLALVSATALSAAQSVESECSPRRIVFPRPNLTKSEAFLKATAQLSKVLDNAVNGSIVAGWDVPNTSFSVAVVSPDQAVARVPAWEYHHRGSNSSNGTLTVDRDSQYHIGSISKVLTTAVFLRSGLSLDDPVTKYLPALRNKSSLISWENITPRALASHMAGIPPNCPYFPLPIEKNTPD